MSNLDMRHSRYFSSKGRTYNRSPSPTRGRFRGRSRERSVSRDRISSRAERNRPRDKLERRRSRDRLHRSLSRNRLRSRSRERYASNFSRGQGTYDIRRSEVQYGYQFQNAMEGDPSVDQPNFERGTRFESIPDRQEFRDIDGQPNYQHEDQDYWRNQEEPRANYMKSEGNTDARYMNFSSPSAAVQGTTSLPEANPNNDDGSVNVSPQLLIIGQDKLTSTVSEFDPTNPQITAQMWIKEIERIGNEKKWSSEEKKLHFTSKLLGSAKEWFISGKRILEPWNRIRKQFIQSFPSEMDFHKSLLEMVQRVKMLDESLSSYFNYKTVLMDKCGISGRKAVSCLIGGLNDSVSKLKQEAYDMNFETSEELYNFLKDKDVNGNIVDNEKAKKLSSKYCNTCKDRGHEQNDCPVKKPKKDPKYYKNVYINGTSLKALFDVKMPKTTLRIKDAHTAKINFRRRHSVINTSEHSKIHAVAEEEIVLKVDSVICSITVAIVPNNSQNTPVVLGTDLLKYANLIETENGINFTSLKSITRKQDSESQEHLSNIQQSYKEGSHSHSYKEHPVNDRGSNWSETSRFKFQEHPISVRSPRRLSPVHSPLRSPPAPQRLFEKSHPFLSKTFYDTPDIFHVVNPQILYRVTDTRASITATQRLLRRQFKSNIIPEMGREFQNLENHEKKPPSFRELHGCPITYVIGLLTIHRLFINKLSMSQCSVLLTLGITGLNFFTVTVAVNSICYIRMSQKFFKPELHRRRINLRSILFQQVEATAHTANDTMKVLRCIFPGHLISRFDDVL